MVSKLLTCLLLGAVLVLQPVATCFAAGSGALLPASDWLVGENYHYAIDFFLFKRLAAGELSFHQTETPGIYEAEVVGRALGVAAWLTGDRTQRYVSRMQLMPDGSLRSLVHESQIIKRKRGKWQNSGKRYSYNYQLGQVVKERGRDGKFSAPEIYELPEAGRPVDILTAFYNLRFGVYGALTPGRRLTIPTFAKTSVNEIVVEVLSAEDHVAQTFFPTSGVLLKIRVDPEIFETQRGELMVWLDDNGVPGRGIIEDLIGLGDLRGYLEDVMP